MVNPHAHERAGAHALAALVLLLSVGCATQPSRDRSTAPQDQSRATPLPNAVTPERGLKSSPPGVARDAPPGVTAEAIASEDALRIHSIPVGAGSCHVIECPNSAEVIIYDCGRRGASPNAWPIADIQEYISGIVADDEPGIVISHPDADHYSYIKDVADAAKAEVVLFGGDEEAYPASMHDWLENVRADRLRHKWTPGTHEPVPELKCGTAEVHMLTVNVEGSKNAQSLLLAVKHGQHTAVFTGDAEDVTQNSAMHNYPDLLKDVTFLTASHHGAYTEGSNEEAWASFTKPKIIVYSSGTLSGHPSKKIVGNYHDSLLTAPPHPMWTNPEYDDERKYDSAQAEYVTELNGLILFETDGQSINLTCGNVDEDCFQTNDNP